MRFSIVFLAGCILYKRLEGITAAGLLPGGGLGGGPNLGGAGSALQGAQALNGVGGLTQQTSCPPPADPSCDAESFDSLGSDVSGGALKGGALQSLSGIGKRRRRGILPSGGAGMVPGGGGNLLSQAQGLSIIQDPNMLGGITRKTKMCQDNQNMQNQMGDKLGMLKSGNLNGIQDSLKSQTQNIGQTCQQSLNTQKQQCDMLKRQLCAFKSGKLNPSSLLCSFQDIMKTSSQIQAEKSGCDTAQQLINNPNNAGSILQNGGKNVGGALAVGAIANKVSG